MRKVLFSTLLLAISFALSAQTTVGYTTYDLQTNVANCRRVAMNATGEVVITYTRSHTGNETAPDRGTGYNYWDGSTWSEGTDFSNPGTFTRPGVDRNGWPNPVFTRNGREVIVSHFAGSTQEGLQVLSRDLGTTSWTVTELDAFPEATWARAATSGDSIIVISCASDGTTNPIDVFGIPGGLLMYRSYDAGDTWTAPEAIQHVNLTNFPIPAGGTQAIGGDVYSLDANEDGVVAIALGAYTNYILKSTDFGENWTIQSMAETQDLNGTPNPEYSGAIGETLDTADVSDEAYSVIVDDNGLVHVWYGLARLFKEDSGSEGTNIFPFSSNLQYWNENMADPVAIMSTEIRPEQTGECGGLFPADDDDIQRALYRTGFISMPSGGYDDAGNLYVVYSGMRAAIVDEDGFALNVNDAALLYRDVFMLKSSDNGVTWEGPFNISNTTNTEEAFPSIPRKIYGTELPVIWMQDGEPGSAIQSPDNYSVPYTDNYIQYTTVNTATEIEISEPWIDLVGLESVDVLLNDTYTDAGLDFPDDASCWTINNEISTVNTAVAGPYTYTYDVSFTNVFDDEYQFNVVRDVNVIAADVTPPVITIFEDQGAGNAVDTVEACDVYTVPSATAFDNIDYANVTASTNDVVNTNVLGDQIVTYSSTDAANNSGTATLTVTVVDRTGPAVDFTENPVYHCLGSAFTAPTPSYTDCITTNVTNTSVDDSNVDVNAANTYLVDYTAEDDAGNETQVSLPVIVGEAPGVTDFEVVPSGGNYIFFTNNTNTSGNPNAWRWEFGDNTPDGSGASTTHTFAENGTYEVCVYVSNQFNTVCGTAEAFFCKDVNIGVGIKDRALDANINIFPNPNTGRFDIEITDAKATDLTITVTNMVGSTVVSQAVNVNGSTTKTIDLGEKATGVYFVTIASENAATTQKVVVK